MRSVWIATYSPPHRLLQFDKIAVANGTAISLGTVMLSLSLQHRATPLRRSTYRVCVDLVDALSVPKGRSTANDRFWPISIRVLGLLSTDNAPSSEGIALSVRHAIRT